MCLVSWCHQLHDDEWIVCVCVFGQEPKVRPSAKYLQQHKFVVAPRPSLAAAALLPLIARSRDALQAMAAASDPPVAPPTSRSLAPPPMHPSCYVVIHGIHSHAVNCAISCFNGNLKF